jgi:hypothetical protein
MNRLMLGAIVQRHLEVALEIVTSWFAEYAGEVASERLDPEQIRHASAVDSTGRPSRRRSSMPATSGGTRRRGW